MMILKGCIVKGLDHLSLVLKCSGIKIAQGCALASCAGT